MLIGDKVEKEYICFYNEISSNRKPNSTKYANINITQDMQEPIHQQHFIFDQNTNNGNINKFKKKSRKSKKNK
jgi:hypothetical protein